MNERRLAGLLLASFMLIVVAPKLSDPRVILTRAKVQTPEEYLPILRGVWYVQRAIGGNIAIGHAAFAAVGAVATYLALRRADARVALFIGPSLLLAGQNYETWVGLAIAFAAGGSVVGAVAAGALKVVPGAALIPLVARKPGRVVRAAVGALVFLVVPAVLAPGAISDAISFAADRTDGTGTVWQLLGIEPATWQPIALLVPVLAGIAWAVRRRLTEPSAVALAILAVIVLNKVWKPHYVLWMTPALAFTQVDLRAVRALEITTLVYFVAIWSEGATRTVVLTCGAARLAAAGVVAWSLWRSGQTAPTSPPSEPIPV